MQSPQLTLPPSSEGVLKDMVGIAMEVSKLLDKEWKAGNLQRQEYIAMMAPTFGAIELTKSFFMPLGPLNDFLENDLPEPEDTAKAKGYSILLVLLFWNLRQVMHNKPEVAQAIRTSHAEIIRIYADITGFGNSLFTERIAAIDEQTAAWKGDPRPAFNQQIIDFIHAISVRGASYKNKLEEILFPATFSEVMSNLSMYWQAVLNNSAITEKTEIIKTLMGFV